MSSSDRGEIEVHAPDAGTEIFIIDHTLRRVAAGKGTLVAKLPPGYYKIRMRTGESFEDSLVELEPRAHQVVRSEVRLAFRSSAPLAGTTTFHEYHSENARRLSSGPAQSFGTGSGVFLFHRNESSTPAPLEGSSVSLLTLDDHLLAVCQADRELGYAWLNAHVAPGTYVMRVVVGGLRLADMFVAAAEGWQTQVFVGSGGLESASRGLLAPFAGLPRVADASMHMSRLGRGFDPESGANRIADLARIGLVQNRDPIEMDEILDWLGEKSENPMVGLFGAHLLCLRRGKKWRSLLSEVVGNLERLIGPIPDVVALKTRPRAAMDPYVPLRAGLELAPPMLWQSWQWLLDGTASSWGAIENDPFLLDLARSAVPSGVWLTRVGPQTPQSRNAIARVEGVSARGLTGSARAYTALGQSSSSASGATANTPAMPSRGRILRRKRAEATSEVERLLSLDANQLRQAYERGDAGRFDRLQRYVLAAASNLPQDSSSADRKYWARTVINGANAPIGAITSAVQGLLEGLK